MRLGLTNRLRWRAGLLTALLYLACVILPPMALAFADGAAAAHCLGEHHHSAVVNPVAAGIAAPIHAHADGSGHVHGKHADDKHMHGSSIHGEPGSEPTPADSGHKSVAGNCCGLFCFSATADVASLTVGSATRARALDPILEAASAGLGPYRIDRPPIVPVSL